MPILSCQFDVYLKPGDVIRSTDGPRDVMTQLMKALQDYHVFLEGLILRFNAIETRVKPNVKTGVADSVAAIPSNLISQQPDWGHHHKSTIGDPRTVTTINCIKLTSSVIGSTVVPAVGGLMLAEGDSLEVSTEMLCGLNMGIVELARHWVCHVSYCFSGILQQGVLSRWSHKQRRLTYTPYPNSNKLDWAIELLLERSKLASGCTMSYLPEYNRSIFSTNVTQL